MKKIIFATLFCLFLCGSLFAQQQVMTLHGGKTTLGQVFKEIESQAGLSVDYDAQEVNITQTVTVGFCGACLVFTMTCVPRMVLV